MKYGLRLTFVSMFVWGIAAAQNDPPGRVGRLNFISGAVSFQPGGVDEWTEATINRPLTTGDHLWSDRDGRAEIHIGSTALRLGSQTAFEFLNLDDNGVQVRLAEGSLVVRLRRLDENESFEVDTPNMAFTLLRPGEYRIDAQPDSMTTIVTVRGGEGEVTGGSQAFSLHARQQARIGGDDRLSFDVADVPPPDGWDRWCETRDIREDRSASLRYVSRDMSGYEDLDANGLWRDVPGYGAVWSPRTVDAGWAPYRYGHWAWVEPWGWTWVDDAAWGFAPFHYGRWAYIQGGWGWVPGPIAVRPVYAPALVAWVGGPHFSLAIGGGGVAGVAWFPLGPREVYVPAYRTSSMYVQRVNITNTNITNINITNVRYVNREVPGAVTAVPQNAMASAQSIRRSAVAVNPREMASAQVVGNAAVVPRRESLLGRSEDRAMSPRPPAAVLNRAVVARSTPPPPQVPFAQRQQALAANPGRPLDSQELGRIRANAGAPMHPLVRQVEMRQGGRPDNPGNPGRPATFNDRPAGPPRGVEPQQQRPAAITPEPGARGRERNVQEPVQQQQRPAAITPEPGARGRERNAPEPAQQQQRPANVAPQQAPRGREQNTTQPPPQQHPPERAVEHERGNPHPPAAREHPEKDKPKKEDDERRKP